MQDGPRLSHFPLSVCVCVIPRSADDELDGRMGECVRRQEEAGEQKAKEKETSDCWYIIP
jgi:hypothetical protein